MAIRQAKAVWQGNLKDGRGTMEIGSGSFRGSYSFRSRFETGAGTNPEELIAAAHAACFCMALSNELAGNDTPPTQLDATAEVTFVAGEGITGVHLTVKAQVEGISADDFARIADAAKSGCPVSQALAVDITLDAELA